MRSFSWKHLGAFVQVIENCSDQHLDDFAAAGGSMVVVVVINDEHSAPKNRELYDAFVKRCALRGIRVGPWVNGFADDPEELAAEAVAFTKSKGAACAPLMYDLEQHYKDERAPLMPKTLELTRKAMPTRPIAVTSFGYFDRAMIWNGRTLTPPASFYDQRVRAVPQWYYLYNRKYGPDWCMADLKAHGASDFNIADATAPGGRGVPLAYVHGVLESTGVEEHSLAEGLRMLKIAQKDSGFGQGFWIYTLERTPKQDFTLLAAERGKLFA